MKILFDHPSPFLLAHGGFQTQIEQTKDGLEKVGVNVEYLRWWDDSQSGDIIHYFGRPSAGYIEFAHQKGMKVVVAELHTGLGSRPSYARFLQKQLIRASRLLLPSSFTAKLSWDAYRMGDAFVSLTSWEKHLMVSMFDADAKKVHIVPNGVEDLFFYKPEIRDPPSEFLVCSATITQRKRVVELAEAAVSAKTPVWIIGKPYSESDPYFQRFLMIQKQNPDWVRYEGAISDRGRLAQIYRQAKGFVLLSSMESLSLSALEAAASGCPLLLSDLPWARSSFGPNARYCRISNTKFTAKTLKSFYDEPNKLSPPNPLQWEDVARQLQSIYQSLAT